MKKKIIPFSIAIVFIALCFLFAWFLPKLALGAVLFLVCIDIVMTMEKNYGGNGKS